MRVEPVIPDTMNVAVELLARFFAEEGFATPPAEIAQNLRDSWRTEAAGAHSPSKLPHRSA